MSTAHIDNFPTAVALGGVDYGTGVHLSGEQGGWNDDTLDLLSVLYQTWAKILNFGLEPGNLVDYTYGKLLRRKIYPITRKYRDKWRELTPSNMGMHTARCKEIIRACGYDPRIVKPLVQVYNELNNDDEFREPYTINTPREVAEAIFWISLAILAEGGIPIVMPTSPGGSWNGGRDFQWNVLMCYTLKDLAQRHYLGGVTKYFQDIAWGTHPYTDTKWLDWGEGLFYKWDLYDFRKFNDISKWTPPTGMPGYEDNIGFLQDEWIRAMVLEITGVEINTVACEGGFCAYGGNFYRGDLDKGNDDSWKMPPAIHASYTTSQMALQMGYTVTDRTCVRKDMLPSRKSRRNLAFWTFGVQGGWEFNCDLRQIPDTINRIKQMTPKVRDSKVIPPLEPPPPIKNPATGELKVEYRTPGNNLIIGNLPANTELSIGYWGMADRHRVKSGTKLDYGVGGIEQLIYGNPPEVYLAGFTVLADGTKVFYKELKIDVRERVAFITANPVPPVKETPPPPSDLTLTLGFAEFAKKHSIRQVKALSMLYYTPLGAMQEVSLFHGSIRRIAWLLWHKETGNIKCAILEAGYNFILE